MNISPELLIHLSDSDIADLYEAISELEELHAEVLKRRSSTTLSEIGRTLGIGRERTRQIEKVAIMKLQKRSQTDPLLIELADQLGITHQ